jgi:hypothetical protein
MDRLMGMLNRQFHLGVWGPLMFINTDDLDHTFSSRADTADAWASYKNEGEAKFVARFATIMNEKKGYKPIEDVNYMTIVAPYKGQVRYSY